jgi:hypothetical protein
VLDEEIREHTPPSSQRESSTLQAIADRLVRVLPEILLFGWASVVMTWPLVMHLSDRVIDRGDPLLTSWIMSWTVRAIGTQPLQLFDGNIFYPEPGTLAYSDHMLAAAPIAAPVWLATGDAIVVNNTTMIVLIALGGWSAFRLALDVTGNRSASAVGGVIFAFSPIIFLHLGHAPLLTTYALPATWLFARRVVREGRLRDVLGLIVFWTLSVLSSWYYGAFISMSLVVLLAVEAILRRRFIDHRRLAVNLAFVVLIVGAVAFAFSRPYVAMQDRYPQATRSVEEAEHYSIRPNSLIASHPDNVLYGELTRRFRSPIAYHEKSFFTGLVPLGLAVFGVVEAARRRRMRESLPWLITGGAMMIIAFGPVVHLFGKDFRFPFYYLFQWLEPLRFIRGPGRAAILTMLALSVLAAQGLARIASSRKGQAVALAALVLVGLEFANIPLTLREAPRPSGVHRHLASSKLEGAVVELPTIVLDSDGEAIGQTRWREAEYVAFSTKHWRPILNGYSGFEPPTHDRMVNEMQSFPNDASIRFLRDRDVSFVVIHYKRVVGSPWAPLADGLNDPNFRLLLDDGSARLYQLLPLVNPDTLRFP